MASVNEMGFNQVAATLNAIQQQVTGQTAISPINNTQDFISVANTTLKAGYDPVLNAISQMVSRTIFSTRPYSRKFKGIFVDNAAYGGHVRKINYVDLPAVDDEGYKLTDDASVDMYKVRKPKVVQTNFYGYNTFSDYVTRFREQLQVAFSGPEQLGEFWANLMVEWTNKHEQFHESMARTALLNFIGGKLAGDTSNVIHLLTEYNAYSGASLTAETMRAPENFEPFIKFAYARIKTIAGLMSERSTKFHVNVAGSEIMRHTPADRLKMYVLAQELNTIQTTVLSSVFNERFLRLVDYEEVNFWQSIDTPASVNVQASYLGTDGEIKTAGTATQTNGVFAVLFDEEAIGQTTNNRSVDVTPYNAAGKYWNTFFHFTERYWNDFTENGVVFLLD